jgi:hypothetical protein
MILHGNDFAGKYADVNFRLVVGAVWSWPTSCYNARYTKSIIEQIIPWTLLHQKHLAVESDDVKPAVFHITTRRGREHAREIWSGVKVAHCTPDQIAQARAAGYEPGTGDAAGTFVARDPRTMTQDELRAMRHEPMSPLDAIRAKCLDCMAGSDREVRLCAAMTRPSWPFRMGKSPWRAARSEAQIEAARILGAKRRGALTEATSLLPSGTTSTPQTAE